MLYHLSQFYIVWIIESIDLSFCVRWVKIAANQFPKKPRLALCDLTNLPKKRDDLFWTWWHRRGSANWWYYYNKQWYRDKGGIASMSEFNSEDLLKSCSCSFCLVAASWAYVLSMLIQVKLLNYGICFSCLYLVGSSLPRYQRLIIR